VGENTHIKRVAVCSGSGGNMLSQVALQGIDAYLTADIKHNVFIDAHSMGITLLDAGHFNTEDIIVPVLAQEIKKSFPEINVAENHFSPIKFAK
jgi:putative NIF3 family GTP cyclohydrolase 1 type 2